MSTFEDIVLSPLQIGLGASEINAAGFWGIPGDQVGFGVVAMIHNDKGEMLFVRKANRPGYEFSGLWAFPGGMVRASKDNPTWGADWRGSLSSRLLAEAGIDVAQVDSWTSAGVSPAPVTSYQAKGAKRYTAVLAVGGLVASAPLPRGGDHTVSECCWMDPVGRWSEIAPANRIIAAAALWKELNEEERREAWPTVHAAIEQCASWAEEAGVAPVTDAAVLGDQERRHPTTGLLRLGYGMNPAEASEEEAIQEALITLKELWAANGRLGVLTGEPPHATMLRYLPTLQDHVRPWKQRDYLQGVLDTAQGLRYAAQDAQWHAERHRGELVAALQQSEEGLERALLAIRAARQTPSTKGFSPATLIRVLARVLQENRLRESHGEDTIGVLMKCGAFRDVQSDEDDAALVRLARQIDAALPPEVQ